MHVYVLLGREGREMLFMCGLGLSFDDSRETSEKQAKRQEESQGHIGSKTRLMANALPWQAAWERGGCEKRKRSPHVVVTCWRGAVTRPE